MSGLRRETLRRRWLRWGLTVGAALLTVAMMVSVWLAIGVSHGTSQGENLVIFIRGGIGFGHMGDSPPPWTWNFGAKPVADLPWRWWHLWHYEQQKHTFVGPASMIWVSLLPLWLCWVVLIAWFWRLRLRPQPGHCRCGYDLSGLADAVCPECGRMAARGRGG